MPRLEQIDKQIADAARDWYKCKLSVSEFVGDRKVENKEASKLWLRLMELIGDSIRNAP